MWSQRRTVYFRVLKFTPTQRSSEREHQNQRTLFVSVVKSSCVLCVNRFILKCTFIYLFLVSSLSLLMLMGHYDDNKWSHDSVINTPNAQYLKTNC